MPYTTDDIKAYDAAPKLRIIAEEYFRADQKRDAIYQLFAERRGQLSLEKISAYVTVKGAAAGKAAIDQEIHRVFTPPYGTGRFNNSKFPAFYTAKEIETCIEEKRHQLKSKSSSQEYNDFRYVIFSTVLSGRLIDLRSTISLGRWSMPPNHDPCKEIAEKVHKAGFDGIAAPSARKINGSCCAIFVKTALRAGQVIQTGAFKP